MTTVINCEQKNIKKNFAVDFLNLNFSFGSKHIGTADQSIFLIRNSTNPHGVVHK